MLQACLGLEIDAILGRIEIRRPTLPQWLGEVHVHSLRLGEQEVCLLFRRDGDAVEAGVTKSTADVELVHHRG